MSTRLPRLVLGLTALAADRVRTGTKAGTKAGETLATVVGLVQQSADAARRVGTPPARAAAGGLRLMGGLPGASLVRGPLQRARDQLTRTVADANARGRETIAAGRADAVLFVQSTVEESLAWVEASVVPRLLDGALPQVRTNVLPVVIDDLTADPRVRDLVVEQSRGMLGEAADQLRTHAASADDRVESAFRRLVGRHPGRDIGPDIGRDPDSARPA